MKKWYKLCPYCWEEIKEIAKKCRFCGEWLSDDKETTETIKEKTTWKSKTKETNIKKSIQKNDDIKVSKPSFEESTIRTYILAILNSAWHILIIRFFIRKWAEMIWEQQSWSAWAWGLTILELFLLIKDIKKIIANQYVRKWIEKKAYLKAIIYSAVVIRFIITVIVANELDKLDIWLFGEIIYWDHWIRNINLTIIAIWIFDLIINCINRKKVNLWRAILPSYLALALAFYAVWNWVANHYFRFSIAPLLILLVFGFIPAICTKIFRYFYDKKNSWNTNKSKTSKKSETKWLFANITMEKILAKKKMILITLWWVALLIILLTFISKHHEKKVAENECLSNHWIHSILTKNKAGWYECKCESGYDREWQKNKSKCISKKEISDRECRNSFWKNSHGDWTKALDWWYVCYCNDWYFFDDKDNPSKCTNDKELWEIYCKDFKNTYSDWSKNEEWEYICRCKTWYNGSIRWGECISSYEESKGTKECQKVFWENSYSDWSKDGDWYNCRCKEWYERNKSNTKCIKK